MNDVIALTQQLISCASITPVDAGCQKILIERLSRCGFRCESMQFAEVENLWARYGTQSPLLVFVGHTDVVPTGPLSDWQSPPFSPEIRAGFLYGRGATDMKGGLAAMIIAAEKFIAANPEFPGSLAFLITSDEEGSSINGTKKVVDILQARDEKISYCIVGEPSSEKSIGDQIRIGRRGSLHGKLIIHGKQGHVAYPEHAKNPIHISAALIHELAHAEWDRGNEYYPPTTFQISNIHAGTGAANVIPGDLEIIFNFRFSTAVTDSQLKARVCALIEKYTSSYTMEWNTSAEPFITIKGRLIEAAQQAILAVTGLEVTLSTAGGTSDGRFIAPTGAELIELGVTHTTAHQINECTRVTDLEKLPLIYEAILQKLFL